MIVLPSSRTNDGRTNDGRTNDGRTNDGRTNDSAPTKEFRDLLMLRSARPFLSEQEWMQIVFFYRRSRS